MFKSNYFVHSTLGIFIVFILLSFLIFLHYFNTFQAKPKLTTSRSSPPKHFICLAPPLISSHEEVRDDKGNIGGGDCGGNPCINSIELYPGKGPGDFKKITIVSLFMHDHGARVHFDLFSRSRKGIFSPLALYKEGDLNTDVETGNCAEKKSYEKQHPPGSQAKECAKPKTFAVEQEIDMIKINFFCKNRSSYDCSSNPENQRGAHVHIGEVRWGIASCPN